ncbi:hypothetical protein [Mesorhizobium sp.]|uniref:hypothetical protein n=1 Tax=Mesorhizobium sp. TaxID=1871066 RepID=UPI000FEA472B|nr:hypothetical protein [Mesorhizobium sp.]RWP31827.1 MAG: hypothetical protein EOR02_08415 [Mesorhizobium sp.]
MLGRAPRARPELIINGDFASAVGWTAGGGWSIGSGVATAVSSGSLTRSISVTPGKAYEVLYNITAWSAGLVTPNLSGGTTASGSAASGVGAKRTIIVANSGNVTFGYTASGSPNLSIDDVSVREL